MNDFSEYRGRIKELIDITQEKRFSAPEEVLSTAGMISDMAGNDSDLKGYAYFCTGDAYYTLSNCEKCFTYIGMAANEFSKAHNWEKLGECYNLLGLMFKDMGNPTSALESFHDGINLVERYGLSLQGAMIYDNYSDICYESELYEEAIIKADKSIEFSSRITGHKRWRALTATAMISKIKSELRLRNISAAGKLMNELNDLISETTEDELDVDVSLIRLLMAHVEHDDEQEEAALNATMNLFSRCTHIVDYFYVCKDLMSYLEENKRYQLLEDVLNKLDEATKNDNFHDIQLVMTKCRINLFKHQKREKELKNVLFDYCRLTEIKQDQSNKMMYQLIKMKNSLKISDQKNLVLKEQTETDELTGIANRRKMNEMADKFFETAYSQKIRLGVEMMDIDRFKMINDSFGHQIGDECLTAVADVLKNIDDETIFCARYGGDEFFVLYLDHPDESIEMTCNRIKNEIQYIIKTRKLPQFTISQGVCNRIPQNLNKVWDYTSLADMALYACKKSGRNRTLIIHNKNDMKDNDINIEKIQ